MRGGWEDIDDANSASSYINDPFGHSSKEVLYKTLSVRINSPLTHGKENQGGGLIQLFIFYVAGQSSVKQLSLVDVLTCKRVEE